jgi:hypothetical protein
MKKLFFYVLSFCYITVCLYSQPLSSSALSGVTHTGVPLDDAIYSVLENAAARGLCENLNGSRPYSYGKVISLINEILNNESPKKPSGAEINILKAFIARHTEKKSGLDLSRGEFHTRTTLWGTAPLVFDAGVFAHGSLNGAIDTSGSSSGAYELWVGGFVNADIGKHFSFAYNIAGGLIFAPREKRGVYNTYYEGFKDGSESEYQNKLITVYSEPRAFFPYTYRKAWDGGLHAIKDLYNFDNWPNVVSGGYGMLYEATASFYENHLYVRAGRINRELGVTPHGSSLFLNKDARPFLGIDCFFEPVKWLYFSSLVGILEFYNSEGIKISAETFQNAFASLIVGAKIKNYFFVDVGSSVVFPKRFELGYILPITGKYFYQNNIGDFDNLAITLNAKAQLPGVGNVWYSLFLDEAAFSAKMFVLDRTMWAMQGGALIAMPFLPFATLKLSYTKINPYCYTHNRNFTPWYGDLRMETSYTNNGVNLGYYLPPNSDEFLFCFTTLPTPDITAKLQYQLIRHGADFGSGAVDGSNSLSELDPRGRWDKPVLRRFFLKDGAYEWINVIKLGVDWKINKTPLTLFIEGGFVYSYFTNITGAANQGSASPYKKIDTSEYPVSTRFIASVGVKVFGN